MKRALTDEAKDARRQQLLDAALDEFFDRGFSAARMDDIAARAKLSKGTLYLYFDSKQALFSEIIHSLTTPKLQELSELARSAPSFDAALDMITAFAPEVALHSNLPKLAKVLIGESNTFPEIVAAYRKNVLEKILAVFTGILHCAIERKEIELDNPELAARLVLAPIMFSGLWHVAFESKGDAMFDVKGLLELQMTLFRKALKPQAT